MAMMNEVAVREYLETGIRHLGLDISVSFHVGQIKSMIDRGALKDDEDVANYIARDVFKINHKEKA